MRLLSLIAVAILSLSPALAQRRVFDHPEVNGYALDRCLYWGRACGQPAADAFCRQKGYREAEGFREERARPTFVLGDDRVCDEGICRGLFHVECVGESNSDARRRREERFTMEYDTDRRGADFRDFALREPDPRACRRACEEDRTCRAFTYVRPGTGSHGDTPWCYLKDRVPEPSRRYCCVTGVKD